MPTISRDEIKRCVDRLRETDLKAAWDALQLIQRASDAKPDHGSPKRVWKKIDRLRVPGKPVSATLIEERR